MPFTEYSIPDNEQERLAALRQYELLDSAAEQCTDDIVGIASHICQVPIALVVLLDEHRQWFKAAKGITATETPRDVAFCAHTILKSETMVVHDARLDARFASNPLVTGSPHIRFYAGVPLLNPEGYALGTLCVINDQPQVISEAQRKTLEALARQTMTQFELRRSSLRLVECLKKVKVLESLLPICSWCRNVRDDNGYWSEIESYLALHSGHTITHGICPNCIGKHFPPDHGPA